MSRRRAHTGGCYESIAAKYADALDDKPFVRFFERPGFLSQLPELRDRRVLDAGCGPGWYTEFAVNAGAEVTAFDLTEEFVNRTRARVGPNVRVDQADLSYALPYDDGAFDVVMCPLVLHYLKDWSLPLSELHRVLAPTGMLVFSTHHPFADWRQSSGDSYFDIDLLEEEWDVGPVSFYRRPIRQISADLESAGFVINRIFEPQPEQELQREDADQYERLMKNPMRLIIRATKNSAA